MLKGMRYLKIIKQGILQKSITIMMKPDRFSSKYRTPSLCRIALNTLK